MRLGSKAQSHIVTRRDFTVQEGEARQFLLEVFYDPQFYDLEILLESKDAPEVKAHGRSALSKSDVSKFKGSKKVFAELEKGDYTFLVVARLPAVNRDTEALTVRYFEYQLYAVASDVLPNKVMAPASLNLLGLLGPKGENFGQLAHLIPQTVLGPQEQIELEFTLAAPADSKSKSPFIDVQVIDADGRGEQLDLRLAEVTKKKEKVRPAGAKGGSGTKGGEGQHEPGETVPPKEMLTYPRSSRYQDDWEDGVAFVAMASADLRPGARYRVSLKNRDSAIKVRATMKLLITEDTNALESRGSNLHPNDFDEIKRAKPKVPGLKESAFIQGSNAVMRTFNVATLAPFVPKSRTVYRSTFRTGPGSENTFMRGLEFEVNEHSSQLYAQLFVYEAPEDLFMALYRSNEGESARQVARSSLGRYANALGPAPLVPGKYRLVVHPNQDSTSLPEGSQAFRFGLDVLLEQSEIGGASDFTAVVEEVELCNQRPLPDSFNGPGFISPLSGGTLQHFGKYRLAELLEGTSVKFDLPAPSLVTFYLEVPEGLAAEAALEVVQGAHQTTVTTKDLNKDDETFLRQEGGFAHRGVIQFREFLSAGPHLIRIMAWEIAGGAAHMAPRCEAFDIALSVAPLNKTTPAYPIGEECLNT